MLAVFLFFHLFNMQLNRSDCTKETLAFSLSSNSRDRRRGVGGPPYPSGKGQKNSRNILNQGFFEIFFAYLIQNGLNDTKMKVFLM